MRASKNQWAVSPETIMSHHFRLAKGIKHVVDATPPHSMYNSPISVHYLPKRASSADPFKRKTLSKSQRELNDFVNGRNGNPHGLRLQLPIRSSLTDLVKPKLLESRNYQPPRRRPPPKTPVDNRENESNKARFMKIDTFKHNVLTEVIDKESFSDQLILNCIRSHMESWAGAIPWDDLEKASDELIEHLGIDIDKDSRNDRRSSRSRSSKKRNQKPPPPFKMERIASPKSLESLSSDSSSSSKSYSSGSSGSTSSSGISS